MNTAIQIISLIGSLSTIVLGVIAIWLSLYFYRRGTELDVLIKNMLSRIEASSKITEVASKDVLNPVIETILGVVRESTRTRIDSLGYRFMQNAVLRLDNLLNAQNVSERQAARKSFFEEINSLLGTLKQEVGQLGLSSESEMQLASKNHAPMKLLPGSSSYNWTPFIWRIRDMENSHKFLSVKWLRETKFCQNPEAQEALQIAINRGMLMTYYHENPKNPQFPVKCCKLNQVHPMVREILQAISNGKAIGG